MKKSCFFLAAGLLLSGCTKTNEEQADPKSSPEKITVTDSELFTGEVKKLAPHLGLEGDAVQLSAPADITVSFDVWKNGKKEEGAAITTGPEGKAETVSFSIRPDGSQEKVTISYNNGEGTISGAVNGMPKANAAYGPADLLGEKGITLKPGEKKAVWGYTAETGNKFASYETEDKVKKAPWGMLVYIEQKKEGE